MQCYLSFKKLQTCGRYTVYDRLLLKQIVYYKLVKSDNFLLSGINMCYLGFDISNPRILLFHGSTRVH
jgi:hypothetical protein